MLYPSAGHFLLVDDVHQLDGVVALHVDHRPLQGVLGHLVELRRRQTVSLTASHSCVITVSAGERSEGTSLGQRLQ